MLHSMLLRLIIHGWLASGTYGAAKYVADGCETPTSWVEHDETGYWWAVCGTADGRVCGRDARWTSVDCANTEVK